MDIEENDNVIEGEALDISQNEVVETPEPKEEPSLRESLSENYDKVMRDRDEAGRFAKKLELPPEKAKELNDKIATKAQEGAKVAETLQVKGMPKAWAKEKEQLWNQLPQEARDVIVKREEDVERMATRLDEDRNVGTAFKKIVDPYMGLINQHGQNPFGVVQNLIQTQALLLTATPEKKKELVLQIIQDYNVDMGGTLPNQKTGDSTNAGSNNEISQLKATIRNLEQQVSSMPQTLESHQLNIHVKNDIEKFAKDPKNVHFDKVKDIMADLMETGRADTLQAAYDKALRLDDELFQQTLAEQEKAKQDKLAQERKAKVESAKRAGSSIHGSPASTAAAPNKNDSRSTREILSETYDRVMSNRV